MHKLRRTDPDIAEEEDEACLRVWIGVLRRLSGKYRESGLPGPNVVGGGRLGGRARTNEIEVSGVFYSPKRWRQMAEDSAIACGVLAAIEHAAASAHTESLPNTQRRDNRAVPTKASTRGDALIETRYPLTPVIQWPEFLRELKAANGNQRIVSAHTIRTWLRMWRETAGVTRPPKKGIPLSHLRAMAEWLVKYPCHSQWLVNPLLQVVQSRIGRETDEPRANRTLDRTSDLSD